MIGQHKKLKRWSTRISPKTTCKHLLIRRCCCLLRARRVSLCYHEVLIHDPSKGRVTLLNTCNGCHCQRSHDQQPPRICDLFFYDTMFSQIVRQCWTRRRKYQIFILSNCLEEKFQETTGVTRSHNQTKHRRYSSQKKKKQRE